MSLSSAFAQGVAWVGGAAILWRRLQASVPQQAVGTAPIIPAAPPQGSLPTLKMPTTCGWAPGQTPTAAPGLQVNAFASGLKHPRWIHVLPNGDVTVAEALFLPGPAKSVFEHAMVSTMKRAAAVGVSPNRITLLRDADGDGVAETREAFLEDLVRRSLVRAQVGETRITRVSRISPADIFFGPLPLPYCCRKGCGAAVRAIPVGQRGRRTYSGKSLANQDCR